MSKETTCGDTSKCICSPGSVAGASLSEWQDGPTTNQSGPEAAPASRSASPGGAGAQLTLAIFGPRCEGSLPSASRKSSSASKSHPQKLSARSLKLLSLSRFKRATTRGLIGSLTDLLAARVCITGEGGSMEYQQTLRNSVTPGGTPYVAHTASGRRTSGRDCGGVQSGWLTPLAQVGPRGYRPAGPNGQLDLDRQVLVAGWPTARAEDSESTGAHRGSPDTLTSAAQVSGWPTPRLPGGGMTSADHSDLPGVAALTGWPPPNSANADRGGFATEEGLRERMESGHQKNLQEVVGIAGWCTPNAMDGGQTSRGGDRIGEPLLAGQAQAAGWATPQARDHFPPHSEEYVAEKRDQGHGMRNLSDEALTGATPGSSAATGPRGALNPQFPLWLMGYPPEWQICAPGHQSWETAQAALSETPDASAKEP